MATQGRRGGSRRRRSSDTEATAPSAVIEPAAALTTEPDVELLEDTSVGYTGARRGGSLARAIPGAMVGALLVVGMAFGAAGPGGILGPKGDGPTSADESPSHAATAVENVAVVQHGGYDVDEPKQTGEPEIVDPEATDKPDLGEPDPTVKPHLDEPDPTKKPKPDATKKPDKPDEPKEPKEPKEFIGLELAIKDEHPLITWGSCQGLSFDYYKVVRSTDSSVSWPPGHGDEMVAAVEPGGHRKAWDKHAPHAAKAWYRVFCVRKSDDGYKVLRSSETAKIWVPAEQEPPDPITLQLEASVNGDGEVVLDWSTCDCEDFGFYKIVRSTTNDNPSYSPWTDGSEVIGVVDDKHATEWVDGDLQSGETAWYRIQCLGWVGDHKVLLGQSAVVEVTVP